MTQPQAPARPEIVVTLPARTPEELKEELALAQAGGADLVEIRLDRIRREDIPRLEWLHQIPLRHEWVPAIATLRSRIEGGEGPDDPTTRREVFAEAFQALPFTYADLEVARDRPILSSMPSSFGRELQIIASAHLPPTATEGEVAKVARDALRMGKIGKVVLPATVDRVIREMLPLCESLRGQPYVVHTTGPSSPLLRVLSGRLGMRLVYCGLPVDRPRLEPGQPPVDRMRATLEAGPDYPWYGVLGSPITHSRSPALHHGFLELSGLPGLYVPIELADPEEFHSAVPRFFGLGARGFNVTRPYKPEAEALATDREESVVITGVANTLLPPGPKGIRGQNTDYLALLRLLGEYRDRGAWTRLQMLVVGSGGLARAAVAAGIELGATVTVVARKEAAARDLVADFPPEHTMVMPLAGLHPFPLVVHATPAGQQASLELEVPIERAIEKGTVLLDGVYLPQSDRLSALAQSRGATYVDGWRLLVYQAALSFEAFTGRSLAPEVVERIAASQPVREPVA